MNAFKKLAAVALAMAVFGFATTSVSQASDPAWKHEPHIKANGDYGMKWAGPRSTRGRLPAMRVNGNYVVRPIFRR